MDLRIRTLLNELKVLLLSHPNIHHMHVRGEESTATRGYLRVRIVLQSRDVIEVFVHLINDGEVIRLKDYSLHWQRKDGALVQRWDSAPHHPKLAGFPHHTHRATGEIEPTVALDWDSLMALLKREILEKKL